MALNDMPSAGRTYTRPRVAGTKVIAFAGQDEGKLLAQIANWRAEEALVSSALLDPAVYEAQADLMEPTDFHSLLNGYYWRAFDSLDSKGLPISVDTVADELVLLNAPLPAGIKDEPATYWIMVLSKLLASCPGIENAHVYAQQVRNAARAFRLLKAADEIRALVFEAELRQQPEKLIDEVNRRIFEATEQREESTATFGDGVSAYAEKMKVARVSGDHQYIPTGWRKLDESLKLITPGEVSCIAGAEGMGKTSFMLNLIFNLLKKIPVILFTLEMTEEEIIRIFISRSTGISTGDLKTGTLTDFEYKVFQEAVEEIKELPLIIFDKKQFPSLTPMQLQRRLRKLFRRQHYPLVAIDGLWLMESDDPKLQNPNARNRAVFDITRRLSDIATGFNTHILYMHQYNAEAYGRGKRDKRPTLADLAESAGPRRNTQIILGLYRAAFYGLKAPVDVTELLVLKDRNGASETRQRFDFYYEKRMRRYEEENL